MKIGFQLNNIKHCILYIVIALPIASCTNQSTTTIQFTQASKDTATKTNSNIANTPAIEDFSKIPLNRKYNDIARYIAGMKAWPGSPYSKLENDSLWVRFHSNFDATWKELTTKRLQPMSAWAKMELVPEQKANLDIFYPLSGPDILHANTFFPDAKEYHLYALERNGALPDLDKMDKKGIENYLTEVYSSLGDVFTKSYFITRKMMTALTANNVNGTLPLICVFLVRTGHEIINVQYFHLNDDGTETPLEKDSLGIHHNDFVKVYFKNNRNTSVQMVSYMKCDLSNDAYQKNAALKSYFTKMPQSTTYLKSASYLLHYAFFSAFRDLILSKSNAILEDDTGIPYKYLFRNKWNVSLYGIYDTPVSDFSGVFQTDLLKAYQDTALLKKPKKLPFSLGYHWGTNKQNLIKAELRDSIK